MSLISLASAFGVLPLLLWRARHEPLQPTELRIAFWYGVICFLAAPFFGRKVGRYTLYAWPLFWLCGGELLRSLPGNQKALLILLSLTVSWLAQATGPVAGFFAEAGLYGCAWAAVNPAESFGYPQDASVQP